MMRTLEATLAVLDQAQDLSQAENQEKNIRKRNGINVAMTKKLMK